MSTPTVTLLPPKQIIRVRRKDDFGLLFTFTTPVDLTGWALTFEWVLRPANTSVFVKTVGAGVTLVAPAATSNQALVTVAKADLATATPSAELPAGQYYEWGLTRTNPGAQKDVAWGEGFLLREITP